MKLDGGLNMRVYTGETNSNRYMSDKAPYGRRVRFLNKNGMDYDLEFANEHMEENDILTVKEIYVGRSRSDVEFIEIPGNKFNTVMFKDIE